MNKIDYDLLNKRLEYFVFDGFPVFEGDFILEERLCNVILKNNSPVNFDLSQKKLYRTRNKVSFDIVVSSNLEYFKSINPKYSDKLQELLDKKLISFENTSDINDKSYLDPENDDIKIMLLKKVEDILSLGHEFTHYLNSRSEIITDISSYYTEMFSNYCEFILIDFLVKKYPIYEKDLQKMKRNIFVALYEKNIYTKIIFELMKKKSNGNNISAYDINEIANNLLQYNVDINLLNLVLVDVLNSILDDEEDKLESDYFLSVRNTIGLVLSCYMYEEYSNKQKEIYELSDFLHNMNLTQVLKSLDLEFKNEEEFDLTEKSYQKIEQSYEKMLKKLW